MCILTPTGTDDFGQLYLLNMPSFLGLKQKNFDPATYEAPRGPHDGSNPSTTGIKFSAFNTAATSIYWRRDPQHPSKVQSNARIVRWSDGSLTLQIASSPKDQYRVSATALRQSFDKKQAKPQATQDYDPSKDSQVYLAAPHAVANVYQIVAPLDAALRILPTGDQADESVLKLQQSLAAATNVHDPLSSLKQVKEDPELAKKAAELFEKDRIRANRRRDLAEEKLLTRKDRVLGRAGLSARGATGLSVAGLEGDDMPSGRGAKKKARRRRTNRRGEILSDDDEDEEAYRRRGREDEYDLADDFMAASDEEPEIYGSEDLEEDDPDVDDLEIEGRQTVIEGKTRGETLANRDRGEKERGREGTPKRPAEDEIDAIDEAGALAGLGSPQARKKRRVIDDDEDEE